MAASPHKPGKSDKILLAMVAAYLALWPFESVSGLVLTARQFLQGLIYIVGGLVLMRWAIKGAQWVVRQFLWRVRHRMVAVFFFVGALPITLGVLLVAWGMLLLFGPLAAYMVTTQVGQRAEKLKATADSLLWQLRETPVENHAGFLANFRNSAAEHFPQLVVSSNVAGHEIMLPAGAVPKDIPDKIATHLGAVRQGNRSWLTAYARGGGDDVLLAAPLSPEYLRRMLPGLGILATSFGDGDPAAARDLRSQLKSSLQNDEFTPAVNLPPPMHPFDWQVVWPIQADVLDWDANEIRRGVLLLQTRLSAVGRMIFASQTNPLNRLAVYLGYGLVGAFVVAVLLSLVIAVSLTRTLTSAVNELYVGTRHVNAGDFAYRVPIAGTDQVSDLQRSFNTMTSSIERLIEDSKERERLESELEIAREVQSNLFPKEPPKLKTLELLGVCRPARSVSGDFFDYVRLSESRVAISFGDVSGKGISAALVMATLHSIVRAQLSLLSRDGFEQLAGSVAELVARANKQLYEGTSPEKFSTLFFSAYDEESGCLAYSNAGHLPPLLIRSGEAIPLEVTGIIVGSFPMAGYESGIVELKRGDLLVAFTDGVTEPENAYEQEYGEDRLREVLLREAGRPAEEIISTVMAEVIEWTGDPTLQDDMTMLVARRL